MPDSGLPPDTKEKAPAPELRVRGLYHIIRKCAIKPDRSFDGDGVLYVLVNFPGFPAPLVDQVDGRGARLVCLKHQHLRTASAFRVAPAVPVFRLLQRQHRFVADRYVPFIPRRGARIQPDRELSPLPTLMAVSSLPYTACIAAAMSAAASAISSANMTTAFICVPPLSYSTNGREHPPATWVSDFMPAGRCGPAARNAEHRKVGNHDARPPAPRTNDINAAAKRHETIAAHTTTPGTI